MTTITREQAQKIIDAADEVITALAGTNDDIHPDNSAKMCEAWNYLNDSAAPPEVVRELARIALASQEAEIAAYLVTEGRLYRDKVFLSLPAAEESVSSRNDGAKIKPLYTATPAPVVPDQWPKKLTWSHHDDMSQAEIMAWNNAIDACRAAMLQGKAEQPQNAQQNIPGNIPESLPLEWVGVDWVEGCKPRNSPVIPDGYVLVPKEPTEAMLLLLGLTGSFTAMDAAYQKMLAASPLHSATSTDI